MNAYYLTAAKFFIMLHQGILPEILEELLAARKRAKADLKVTPICLLCQKLLLMVILNLKSQNL